MKYGQIIKPEDVPRLVQCGELRFGALIEFYDDTCDQWTSRPHPFYGVNTDQNLIISPAGDFPQARFPLPNLKDGDPIVVGNLKLHFRKYGEKGVICYCEGLSSWSNRYKNDYTPEYCHSIVRLPTEEELHDAGLDGWYDGRIELEEG